MDCLVMIIILSYCIVDNLEFTTTRFAVCHLVRVVLISKQRKEHKMCHFFLLIP